MSAEIKSLRGASPVGHPVPQVVELLEDLLDRAKAGDIQGIAYAVTYTPRDGFGAGWEGNSGFSHQLGAAVSHLFHRYYASFCESEE